MEGYKISLAFLVIILTLVYGRTVQNPCDSQSYFPCDNGQCVWIGYWCDDEFDCKDGSDEKYCKKGPQEPCESNSYYPCDNGECIPIGYWCDNERDCKDGSDEKYCKIGSPNNCTDKQFACGDLECIPASLRCNGDYDCADRTDENNCGDLGEPTYFSEKEPDSPVTATEVNRTQKNYNSSDYLTPTTSLYDRTQQDESYNYNRRYVLIENPCKEDFNKIPCDNGQCILPDFWCDGYNDCSDKSDENYCKIGSDNNCTDKHFVCGNLKCIPASLRCDGKNNCDDKTDERNCDTPIESTTTVKTFTDSYDFGTERRSHSQPTTQNPTRTGDTYPYREDRNMYAPPKTILYPQYIKPSSSQSRNVRRPDYSRFYFTKNYTQDYEYEFERNIDDAKVWLISKRDTSYSWGRDTPRALIALSLISNSFKSEDGDNELLKKSLQTHLGIKILRNNTGIEKISTTRLAMYINALLATCQNPRDFLGMDLAEILHQRQYFMERHQTLFNPLISLSLCLTDMTFSVDYLEYYLKKTFPTEISKDYHILATTAMACALQKDPRNRQIRDKLNEAAQNLLSQMNVTSGSFGSKYSTALAVQALMSVNTSLNWKPKKTLEYLAGEQLDDGSFGDMQSTYYTLIALSGRSLLHLRNTLCDATVDVEKEWSPEDILNREGPRKNILYTVKAYTPETLSVGFRLTVHIDTNFYDIMRVAAYQDPRFKFNYKTSNGVDAIANIPNDPEFGTFWSLFRLSSSDKTLDLQHHRYTKDIKSLIPNDGDEMIFWYLRDPVF